MRRRGRRDPGRAQPVPAGARHPRAPRRDRRAPAALRTASTSTPTPRCSSPRARPRRSRPRCSRCASRATRSSPSSRTTTRTPRASRWPAPTRRVVHAAPAGLRVRPRRAARPRSRRARGSSCSTRRTTRPARCSRATSSRSIAALCVEHDLSRSPTRCTSTSSFDGEHVPLATLPGHARPHGHDLVGGQDVLVHRLEDRLGRARRPSSSPRCARRSSSSPT